MYPSFMMQFFLFSFIYAGVLPFGLCFLVAASLNFSILLLMELALVFCLILLDFSECCLSCCICLLVWVFWLCVAFYWGFVFI